MKKRVKIKDKKKFQRFVLFIFVTAFLSVNYTSSFFSSTTDTIGSFGIAKFNVIVNDSDLSQEKTFDLDLSSVSNTKNGKISPDSEGFFDFEIDLTRYRSKC